VQASARDFFEPDSARLPLRHLAQDPAPRAASPRGGWLDTDRLCCGGAGPSDGWKAAVLQGSVKIVSLSPTGKEVVLKVIHAGEVFGEIAVIDGEERSAGAAAMTDCELLIIDRRDVLPMFERHLEIWMTLTQILCRRLRRTSEQAEDFLSRSLEARLAKALLQLMEDAKRAESRDPEVVLHLSQNDLAMIAGGSRESVNKLLHAWTGGVDRAGPGLDRDPRCGGPRAVGLTMFDQTARQLPELSTIPWMDPSFTGDTRPRGALQNS
jgi:CRP-like cAMP-binding protein